MFENSVFLNAKSCRFVSECLNLLIPLGMKGWHTKINWYVSSKYLCKSCNDRDTFFHATMILTHLLKLTKLLAVKIITKHTALKIVEFRLP